MTLPTFELLKRRRTKIVATLGPASREPDVILALIRAGVDVFRMNMSHGDHAFHRMIYERIREAAAAAGASVATMADLCGPKIRVGTFEKGGIDLHAGAQVTVTTRKGVIGKPGLIPSQYEGLTKDVRPGSRLLLDDGNLELRVVSIQDDELTAEVVYGGFLKDKKGMNLPDVALSIPALTDKDKEDAKFALELGVDLLALSFVQRPDDVIELRQLAKAQGKDCFIVAKIEKPAALRNIDAILTQADAIMVARGDLGVELAPEEVPVAQDMLVDRGRTHGKPVIVATQMLESMVSSSRPTRAEVSDVSHAVRSGCDAIMLSGETAAGAHPVRAVSMMDAIARHTEGYLWHGGAFAQLAKARGDVREQLSIADAVARATSQLSRDLKVRSVVAISMSGSTASLMSSARPAAPLITITADPLTCRRMILLWGAVPVLVEPSELTHTDELARRIVKQLGLAGPGHHILVVRGFKSDPHANLPSVTVVTV